MEWKFCLPSAIRYSCQQASRATQGQIQCKLRPRCCISDTLGIQFSFNGVGEEICVDLLLLIFVPVGMFCREASKRCFCRVRQYTSNSRQVRTAVHGTYLHQCILRTKNWHG